VYERPDQPDWGMNAEVTDGTAATRCCRSGSALTGGTGFTTWT